MSDLSNVTVCHTSKSGNIITPKGVLTGIATHLYEGAENKQGELRYNFTLCFPPSADLKLLKQEMLDVVMNKANFDKERAKQVVNNRFLDPNNRPKAGKPLGEKFEGWTMLSGSAKYAPDFVYPNGKKCPVEKLTEEVYAGRHMRVTLNVYWSAPNSVVSLGLQNVQLLDHGEPIGFVKPDAESEFDKVELDTTEKSESSDDDLNDLFDD